VSVWTGTRLGRLVGLTLAVAGSWWSATSVAERLGEGFGPAAEEVRWILLLGALSAATTVALILAIRDWVALVLAERH
jgi:hypothetical protein